MEWTFRGFDPSLLICRDPLLFPGIFVKRKKVRTKPSQRTSDQSGKSKNLRYRIRKKQVLRKKETTVSTMASSKKKGSLKLAWFLTFFLNKFPWVFFYFFFLINSHISFTKTGEGEMEKGRREQGDDIRKQGVGKKWGRGDRETRLKEEKEWRKHRERNFTKIKCTYVYVGR